MYMFHIQLFARVLQLHFVVTNVCSTCPNIIIDLVRMSDNPDGPPARGQPSIRCSFVSSSVDRQLWIVIQRLPPQDGFAEHVVVVAGERGRLCGGEE